jgi:hypothetical protein
MCLLLCNLFIASIRTLRFLHFCHLHLNYSVLLLPGILFAFVDFKKPEYRQWKLLAQCHNNVSYDDSYSYVTALVHLEMPTLREGIQIYTRRSTSFLFWV